MNNLAPELSGQKFGAIDSRNRTLMHRRCRFEQLQRNTTVGWSPILVREVRLGGLSPAAPAEPERRPAQEVRLGGLSPAAPATAEPGPSPTQRPRLGELGPAGPSRTQLQPTAKWRLLRPPPAAAGPSQPQPRPPLPAPPQPAGPSQPEPQPRRLLATPPLPAGPSQPAPEPRPPLTPPPQPAWPSGPAQKPRLPSAPPPQPAGPSPPVAQAAPRRRTFFTSSGCRTLNTCYRWANVGKLLRSADDTRTMAVALRAIQWPADLVMDVRPLMQDPETRGTRHLGGHISVLQQIVLAAIADIKKTLTRTAPANTHIAFYCKSGRHRSVAMATMMARILNTLGSDAESRHLCQYSWNGVPCQHTANGCADCALWTPEKEAVLQSAVALWRQVRI